jgi:hypothetical protein
VLQRSRSPIRNLAPVCTEIQPHRQLKASGLKRKKKRRKSKPVEFYLRVIFSTYTMSDLKDDTKHLWCHHHVDSSDDDGDGDAWNTGARLTQGQVLELAASFAEATDPRPVEGQQRRIPADGENCRYFGLNQSINSADHCVGKVATFGIN